MFTAALQTIIGGRAAFTLIVDQLALIRIYRFYYCFLRIEYQFSYSIVQL